MKKMRCAVGRVVAPAAAAKKGRRSLSFLVAWAAVMIVPFLCAAASDASAMDLQKRWIFISRNLYIDENMPRIEGLLRRARRAGYTGVLVTDIKTQNWRRLEAPDRWKANAARLRRMATDLNLELIVSVFPFGYAEALLSNDVNLAAGLPIKDAPLVRSGGRLIPQQTAVIKNGSFEEHDGDRASGYDVQDSPGTGSCIDSMVFIEGRASLRFENVSAANDQGNGRILQEVAVKPWQQYRIRIWLKAEHLTADKVQLIALAGERPLQYQCLVVPRGKIFRYSCDARNLTTDWVEQSVTFNSLDNTSVTVGAGVWGCRRGTVWWDDLRIDAVPTLNVLRRDALPLTVVGENGFVYEEGKDFDRIADPGLGVYRWPGTYDTRHVPPHISIAAGSRIKEGERVDLSCCHTVVFFTGQMYCSMDDKGVFDLCAEEIRNTRASLSPDGYFMSHDEIRCAGWEPSQMQAYHTTGELFAFNIKKCYEIASREGGGKPVYVWSDMFDPYHNAHADYFLVNNTIAHSWDLLDSNITVMKWGEKEDPAAGLRFFSGRGNRLMIAGYYDEDVEANHTVWMNAAEGVPGIVGVMYTTWRNDYSKLEEFARVWWGGGK
jgi:hypothetical protein